MADFSFLSDTDESAVEEILSEAADHVALKQISAINLSGVSDSVLPQHLESRFRRLKTFPSSRPPPESAPKLTDSARNESDSGSGSAPAETPDVKPVSSAKSRSGSARRRFSRSPSPTPSSSSGSSWLETKNSPKLKAEKGLFGSGRRSGSVSPPPNKTGCLWCSPKRALKKLSFSKRSGGGGGLDWGGNDGVLEELGVGSLSRREQEKILKRAAKEEMKINEEAEKIVKWAKHVSARMETFGLEDDDHELHYK